MKRVQNMLIAVASIGLLGLGLLSNVHGQGGTDAPLTADQPNLPASSVAIDNFSFSPASITVPAGTTLTWTNRDDIPHTVVSDDKKFKSKALDTDEKFSFTFTEPGTYSYFCSIHPKMRATVTVK